MASASCQVCETLRKLREFDLLCSILVTLNSKDLECLYSVKAKSPQIDLDITTIIIITITAHIAKPVRLKKDNKFENGKQNFKKKEQQHYLNT